MGVTVIGGDDGGANVLSLDPTKAAERLGALYSLVPTVHTSTQVTFSLGTGDLWTFTGKGFSNFNANGVPQSGTITGMSFVESDGLQSIFQGMSLSMKTAWTAVTEAHNGDLNAAPDLLAEIFAGNDTFISYSSYGTVGDTFMGGGGNDTFYMDNSAPGSRVWGGAGNDTFIFGERFYVSDLVDGGTGTDTLDLDGGYSNVYYQPASPPGGSPSLGDAPAYGLVLEATTLANVEKINLAAGSSYGLIFNNANVAPGQVLTINASALGAGDSLYINGSALVSGGALNVTAGAGNSVLIGGSGNDVLTGGAGNDVLDGGAGNDRLNGGGGVNTAVFHGDYSAYHVSQSGGVTTVSGPDGTDTLKEIQILRFDDAQVVNSSTGMTLTARAGGDTLIGGKGNDTLIGGTGNDILIGGAGQDTLTGGSGQTSFVFTAVTDSKVAAPDLITNFVSGPDKIDISDLNSSLGAGHSFHLGATTTHTGDIVVSYDSVHNRTVVDLWVGNHAKADMEIWLSGDHALSAADFTL